MWPSHVVRPKDCPVTNIDAFLKYRAMWARSKAPPPKKPTANSHTPLREANARPEKPTATAPATAAPRLARAWRRDAEKLGRITNAGSGPEADVRGTASIYQINIEQGSRTRGFGLTLTLRRWPLAVLTELSHSSRQRRRRSPRLSSASAIVEG